MLPAAVTAISGLMLIVLWIVTSTTWVMVTEEQKTKAQGVMKYFLGVFVLATVANLYFQFKPDVSKKTLIESASTTV